MTYDTWAAVVLIVVIYTAIAVPMMRHYAPQISRWTLTGYALTAFITAVALVTAVSYGVPMPAEGAALMAVRAILIFVGYSIPGAILSTLLKRRGVSKPFPGIGARVMIVLFAFQAIPTLIMVALSPK